MRRILCPHIPRLGEIQRLDPAEEKHLKTVLRVKTGTLVEVLDGKGKSAICSILVDGRKIEIKGTQVESKFKLSPQMELLPAVLEVSILKGSDMDSVIKKAVELGVEELVPLVTTRSIIKVNKDNQERLMLRWNKISEQALKQCGRLKRMKISQIVKIEKICDTPHRYVFNEQKDSSFPYFSERLNSLFKEECKTRGNIHITIGPEGGWDSTDLDILNSKSSKFVTMGPIILKAETACIYACSILAEHIRSNLLDKKDQKK